MNSNKLKNILFNCLPKLKKIGFSLLSFGLTANMVFGQTPYVNIKLLSSQISALPNFSDLGQRPGVTNNPPPTTNNSNQTRPGTSSARPGIGPVRPGTEGSVGLRPGISLSRPGVVASSRPGLEQSQILGTQQNGEASAQAKRKIVTVAVKSGPETTLDSIDKLVDKGDYEKAIAKCEQLIKENPNLAKAYADLGYVYIQMEDFEKAIDNLEEAVAKNKNDQEAQLNLGVAYYRGGYIAKAIEKYTVLIKEKSTDPEVYYNLGIAYAHDGNFDEAVTQMNLAISKRKNKYPDAYNNLGLIYEAKGDNKKAIECFQTAALQEGNYPLANYNLARLYQYVGDGGKESKLNSIEQYKKTIKQKANFAEAYLGLGNVQIFMTIHSVNSLGDALKAYQDAVNIRKGIYPLAHENIAITYSKMGKKQEALEHYYLAFEQYDGRCPEALINLVTTLKEEQTFTITDELAQTSNEASLSNKQRKKFAEKDNRKADDVFFRTMKNLLAYEDVDDEMKNSSLAHYCGGRAYAFVGDWASATEEFIQAIEIAKKEPQFSKKAVGNQQIDVVEDAQRAVVTIASNNLVAMLP